MQLCTGRRRPSFDFNPHSLRLRRPASHHCAARSRKDESAWPHHFDNKPFLQIDVPLDKIEVRPSHRATIQKTVDSLAVSLREEGLSNRVLISSRLGPERRVLIAGRHRLEAARQLGWVTIPAYVLDMTETGERLREISENLCRSELTRLERAEQISEWIRLTGKSISTEGDTETDTSEVSAQVAPKPHGRPEGGVRAAARELGIDRDEARRSDKIDSIVPEAKEAARAAGLDDNQSALLKIAAAAPDKQVEVLAGITKAKAEKKTTPPIELGASEYTVEPSKLPANESLSPAEAIAVDVFRLLQDMPHADVIEFVRLVNDYDNIRMIRDPDGYVPALEAFIAKHGRQEALLESASAMAKEIIAAAKDAQPVEVATFPVEVELDRSAPWKGLAAAVAQAKTAGIPAPVELAEAA